MDTDIKNSIDRAIRLMSSPPNYEDYIALKVLPSAGGCCCFNHCWLEAREAINKYIYPNGPIEDEGDVLILKNNEKFVLESHESGPEIILYLGLAAASVSLVKSVIELIVAILKARQNDRYKSTGRIKIIKRYQFKGKSQEEKIIELDLPLTEKAIKLLHVQIKSSIKKRKGNK